MTVFIGSQLTVLSPTPALLGWCRENLVLDNPEYRKKQRMNLWLGKTPKQLTLYEVRGHHIVLPYGCLDDVLRFGPDEVVDRLPTCTPSDSLSPYDVPLYDYQETAVQAMQEAGHGILQAPAGSGKTQMALALALRLGLKTLWLTHTTDLLTQSKARAEQFIPKTLIGTITGGKVQIGQQITFATIQTMNKLDLNQFRDEWGTIICDECHHVSGSPTTVTQYYRVLSALAARHKYGLTATVHRADGLIRATYALIGDIAYTVSDAAVKSRIMQVSVLPVKTCLQASGEYLNSDGTINYTMLINYVCNYPFRNAQILQCLRCNSGHSNLILSERVGHLKLLYNALPPELRMKSAVIDGKMSSKKLKAEREQAIEDMRTGEKRYLFATYSLAKEGLDIPRLDRLYLATPQKDYAVIVQSVGRVARTFPDKEPPLVYDFVDDSIAFLVRGWRKRRGYYRRLGCRLLS